MTLNPVGGSTGAPVGARPRDLVTLHVNSADAGLAGYRSYQGRLHVGSESGFRMGREANQVDETSALAITKSRFMTSRPQIIGGKSSSFLRARFGLCPLLKADEWNSPVGWSGFYLRVDGAMESRPVEQLLQPFLVLVHAIISSHLREDAPRIPGRCFQQCSLRIKDVPKAR